MREEAVDETHLAVKVFWSKLGRCSSDGEMQDRIIECSCPATSLTAELWNYYHTIYTSLVRAYVCGATEEDEMFYCTTRKDR